MTDVEELEKQFNAPSAVKPEEKTEEKEEWSEQCVVWLGSWQDENVSRCNKPAWINTTMVCPFQGPRKSAYCKEHAVKAFAGEITCSSCSRKANTGIYLRPLNARWKND